VIERVRGACQADVMEDGAHAAEFVFEVASKVAVGMSAEYGPTQPRRVRWHVGAEYRNRCGFGERAGRMMAQAEGHAESSAGFRHS
jgi:hypothetical protein